METEKEHYDAFELKARKRAKIHNSPGMAVLRMLGRA